jgi:hypothetical protein
MPSETPKWMQEDGPAIAWLRAYVSAHNWGAHKPGDDYRIFGTLWLSHLRDALSEYDRLRAALASLQQRAERAEGALRAIDDVLYDGDSPALPHLEAAARHDPGNMARCYSAVVEIAREYDAD